MKVELAESAGFCFGVSKAIDSVNHLIEEKKGRIYTFGPIIHNDYVVKELANKGVKAVSYEEIDKIEPGIMVIRSHGVAEEIYTRLRELGFEIVDATCPFVKRIHKIVREKSLEGKNILIFGNRSHPEVEGIVGWCKTIPIVVETEEELYNLKLDKETETLVVAQTTFNFNKFNKFNYVKTKKKS